MNPLLAALLKAGAFAVGGTSMLDRVGTSQSGSPTWLPSIQQQEVTERKRQFDLEKYLKEP